VNLKENISTETTPHHTTPKTRGNSAVNFKKISQLKPHNTTPHHTTPHQKKGETAL
jgi:hypothetical protein